MNPASEGGASAKLNRSLRCGTCNTFAYHDQFTGDYGVSGYTCRICLRALDHDAAREGMERYFREQKERERSLGARQPEPMP